MKFGVAIAGLLFASGGAMAFAQAPLNADRGASAERAQPVEPVALGMPDVDVTCAGAEEFGGTAVEQSAFCAAARDRQTSVRTLADRALMENERSFRAHFLMGFAQHVGEGNLPKALYHLERAARLFEDEFGVRPVIENSPWRVYHRILRELVYVHGEMDHHAEKLRYVDALNDRLGLDYQALKAWPLLKLKRFDEARAVSKAAIASEDPWARAVGLTALCAVESELRNRTPAYEACTAAAQDQDHDLNGAIELSNAGAAAEEMMKFDEAERYYLDASRRPAEGSVNPWGRLVRLYLRQGRFAEGVSAWREMRTYREGRPGSYLDQQDQSDADLIGASVLLVAGKIAEAERITDRTVRRPDRQGTSSASSEQNEAGAAITDRVAKRAAARVLEEEASISGFFDALKLRAQAMDLRFSAWVSGRRAADVLADRERLVTSFRPECPGSVELSTWLDAEMIELVGPGVALAAIQAARLEETLPDTLSEPTFLALEAEARLGAGRTEEALEIALSALELFSESEVMLRARVAAVAAVAAERLGDVDAAMAAWRIVLANDPQVVRRLGLALPARIVPARDSASVLRAVEMLGSSPMFESAEWGFVLVVDENAASLQLSDGSVVVSLAVPPGRAGDEDAVARRIARAVHRELLVPSVDITQADIRSLDGSLSGSARATDQVKGILQEITE